MASFRSGVAILLVSLSVLSGCATAIRDQDSAKDLNNRQIDVQVGPRPAWLVDGMDAGPLKEKLERCDVRRLSRTDFSIGHRGAPLQFPEHTLQSYVAAARMGAGIVECDVAFTADRELVCRHAQNDLHTTTNIVTIP
jgi:glycerophosphoryl diester phosphodiesterase